MCRSLWYGQDSCHQRLVEDSSCKDLISHYCAAESDADVVCQAGVAWNDLNETLREKGPQLLDMNPPLALTSFSQEFLFFSR